MEYIGSSQNKSNLVFSQITAHCVLHYMSIAHLNAFLLFYSTPGELFAYYMKCYLLLLLYS
jgi:hypothetical protein